MCIRDSLSISNIISIILEPTFHCRQMFSAGWTIRWSGSRVRCGTWRWRTGTAWSASGPRTRDVFCRSWSDRCLLCRGKLRRSSSNPSETFRDTARCLVPPACTPITPSTILRLYSPTNKRWKQMINVSSQIKCQVIFTSFKQVIKSQNSELNQIQISDESRSESSSQ